MDSEFHLTSGGALAGSYYVDARQPYDGTLTDFTPTAPCEADFLWHDTYGTGHVHIRFAPDHGRFRGLWHTTDSDPGYRFDGDRALPALESRALFNATAMILAKDTSTTSSLNSYLPIVFVKYIVAVRDAN